MKQVMKRHGRLEAYDERKVYASVYASVIAARGPQHKADEIADSVCRSIHKWLQPKTEVTSTDLRHQIAKTLHKVHPTAGYLYEHHRILM